MTVDRSSEVEAILRGMPPPNNLGLSQILSFWGEVEGAARVHDLAVTSHDTAFRKYGPALAGPLTELMMQIGPEMEFGGQAAEQTIRDVLAAMSTKASFAASLRQAGLDSASFAALAPGLIKTAIASRLVNPPPGRAHALSMPSGAVTAMPFTEEATYSRGPSPLVAAAALVAVIGSISAGAMFHKTSTRVHMPTAGTAPILPGMPAGVQIPGLGPLPGFPGVGAPSTSLPLNADPVTIAPAPLPGAHKNSLFEQPAAPASQTAGASPKN